MKKATALKLKPGDVIECISGFHLLSASRSTHLKSDRCVVMHNNPDHESSHFRDIRIEDAVGSPFHFWIAFSWNRPEIVARFEGSKRNVFIPWWELFKKVRRR